MDKNKQIILESEISDFIKRDSGCNTHFDYKPDSIKVTTYNPKKQATFLLIELPYKDIIEGLKEVSSWVKTHNLSGSEFSHTIVWAKRGDSHTYKSYFYASSVRKSLDKFFDDKSESEYIIYEVKLNPIS